MKDIKIVIYSVFAVPCLIFSYLFRFVSELFLQVFTSLSYICAGLVILLLIALGAMLVMDFSFEALLGLVVSILLLGVVLKIASVVLSVVGSVCTSIVCGLLEGIAKVFWKLYYFFLGGISNAAKGK